MSITGGLNINSLMDASWETAISSCQGETRWKDLALKVLLTGKAIPEKLSAQLDSNEIIVLVGYCHLVDPDSQFGKEYSEISEQARRQSVIDALLGITQALYIDPPKKGCMDKIRSLMFGRNGIPMPNHICLDERALHEAVHRTPMTLLDAAVLYRLHPKRKGAKIYTNLVTENLPPEQAVVRAYRISEKNKDPLTKVRKASRFPKRIAEIGKRWNITLADLEHATFYQ